MLEHIKHIELFDPLLRPRNFFAERDRDYFGGALKTLAIFLGAGTLLIFGSTVANLKELEMFNLAVQNQSGLARPEGWGLAFQNALPWNRLTFPVFWFTVIFTVGAVRHLFLVVLGEQSRDLGATQAVTIFGVLPLFFLLLLTGIIGNLAPTIPRPGEVALGLDFYLMATLLPLALAWDGYICLKGFRAMYGQNTGRALLTWLAPALSALLLLTVLLVASIVWSILSAPAA